MARNTDAFVVWFDRAVPPAADPETWSGYVEHVRSSQRARFASREELLRFLARRRRAASAPPTIRPRAPSGP